MEAKIKLFPESSKGKLIGILMIMLCSSAMSDGGVALKRWQLNQHHFTDYVEYEYVIPRDERLPLGSPVWFVSSRNIKRHVEEIQWDETLECDYTPFDETDSYSYFAPSESRRVMPKIGDKVKEWPFKNSDDVIIRGPARESKCRLESVMTIDIGYGVLLRDTYVTDDIYFGVGG